VETRKCLASVRHRQNIYYGHSLLWLFIYSSAAVFIVVGGQSTTDESDDVVDQLVNTVATLQRELAKLAAKNEKPEAEVAKLGGNILGNITT